MDMKTRIAAGLLAGLITMASGGCPKEEGDQHPSAPRVNPRPPTIKATNEPTAAIPVPNADPFMRDRAKNDPHTVLFQLGWFGKGRTFEMRYTTKAGGSEHTHSCPVDAHASEHLCYLVLVVLPGDVIGFLGLPLGDTEGFAQCQIWYKGKTLAPAGYQHVQRGACAASGTIPG